MFTIIMCLPYEKGVHRELDKKGINIVRHLGDIEEQFEGLENY